METIDTIVLMGYSAMVEGAVTLSPVLTLGTKDSYGLEKLRIVRGAGWDGLEILAVFHAPSGTATKVTVGADGVLTVPPEATTDQAGRGKIVFVGLAEDAQRITVDLAYTIRDHADTEGDNPGTPTPDVVQQILANSNNAVSIATAAQDAAENAHRAAEEAAKKAGEEAGGAAASAEAAKKSAEGAAASSKSAADNAEESASSAGAAAEDAKAAKTAQGRAESAAKSAAGSASAAADSADSIVGAQEATAASAEAAKKSAEDAQAAAKAAGDAATKVIEEGVADKLTQMENIQTDVTDRQADVTEKQKQVNASVELAQQAAAHNGYMQMGIDPDTGHLLYTRTTNLKDQIDFEIINDTNLEVQVHG